jgi:hypothetical protein
MAYLGPPLPPHSRWSKKVMQPPPPPPPLPLTSLPPLPPPTLNSTKPMRKVPLVCEPPPPPLSLPPSPPVKVKPRFVPSTWPPLPWALPGGTASAAQDRATVNASVNATVVNIKTRFINRRDPFCRGTKEERVFSARGPCLYSIIKYRGGNAAWLYARWPYLFAVAWSCLRVANFSERRVCELPRIRLPRTWVNKGERMSRWANTGRDEGSVPIMGSNSERRQAGGRM